MIILTILLIALAAIAIASAIAVLAGGIGFVVVFGDVILAGLVIWFIIRLIRRRK